MNEIKCNWPICAARSFFSLRKVFVQFINSGFELLSFQLDIVFPTGNHEMKETNSKCFNHLLNRLNVESTRRNHTIHIFENVGQWKKTYTSFQLGWESGLKFDGGAIAVITLNENFHVTWLECWCAWLRHPISCVFVMLTQKMTKIFRFFSARWVIDTLINNDFVYIGFGSIRCTFYLFFIVFSPLARSHTHTSWLCMGFLRFQNENKANTMKFINKKRAVDMSSTTN